MRFAAITIGMPTIELGPITPAWHGITIAVGIVLGGLLAGRCVRERGIDPAPLITLGVILTIAGVVGARIFFLRVDGDEMALGLSSAQWTSVALVVAALVGAAFTRLVDDVRAAHPPAGS